MEQIIRQCIGIDCAKDSFVVSFSVCDSFHEVEHRAYRTFRNDFEGFKGFNKWLGKFVDSKVQLTFVLEATGVYHERLTYFLDDLKYRVAVLLPKRAKDFSKTLKIKKVTDKIAAQSLATMGLEKKLDLWVKPKKVFKDLKSLTREKDRIQKQIQEAKNHLHAENAGMYPHPKNVERITSTIEFLSGLKKQVLEELNQLIKANQELEEKINKITTIPGVGMLTVATVIAETHGFDQVQNKRQLVSYAGYDVMNQESGTSVYTKPRISKRGNKRIRKAMHMPALSSIKWNDQNRNTFTRIVSKTGIKMKGVVAVQRKLLILIYTLWKTDNTYDPEYDTKKKAALRLPHELEQVCSRTNGSEQI